MAELLDFHRWWNANNQKKTFSNKEQKNSDLEEDTHTQTHREREREPGWQKKRIVEEKRDKGKGIHSYKRDQDR